jgi:hypothetical protein
MDSFPDVKLERDLDDFSTRSRFELAGNAAPLQ